jgi:hypothetical protein
MFPYEPAALPQACRAGQSAVAPTTRGRHSESSLEAHTHNPAHCAPSYLDFRREHKRREQKGRDSIPPPPQHHFQPRHL